MEHLLKEILAKLEGHDKRFTAIDKRFDQQDERFSAINKRFDQQDDRFSTIDKRFDQQDDKFAAMDAKLLSLEKGQEDLSSEQIEMRKEVGFYYGSLMKKLDEVKTELSSEVKHVTTVQKQHQKY